MKLIFNLRLIIKLPRGILTPNSFELLQTLFVGTKAVYINKSLD